MFNSKYKQQIEQLNSDNSRLIETSGILTSQIEKLRDTNSELINKLELTRIELNNLQLKFDSDTIIAEKMKIVNELTDKINDLSNTQRVQTLGFYELQYGSRYYRDELSKCRLTQKRMLIDKTYYKSSEDWSINGDIRQGNKLLEFFVNICITSFNMSCDNWLDKITIANYDYAKIKVEKIWNNYNNELIKHKAELVNGYLQLKLNEMDVRRNIYIKEQQEKEEERKQREIIKEQVRAELELNKNKEKLEKELLHYQIQANKGEDVADKIKEIEDRIETDDYMLSKTRAGYVYIIQSKSFSNESQFKIGMTRQCDPNLRLAQLSDASIPFKYYPSAIIFTDDAFELETKLHRRLAKYKVNKFNQRKEHFIIDKDELLHVLNDEFNLNVGFSEIIDEEWLFSIDKCDK